MPIAGPSTRSTMSVIERRQHVAARYLRGEFQSQIARDLGLTQAQISFDLKAVRAQWLASTLRDFDALKSEQLAKVDAIEVEAWAAWERSKQPREVTVTEQSEGQSASRKASVRREGQAGDPRFLERIQKCIEQRCTILGLFAPIDVNQTLTVEVEARTRAANERLLRLRHAASSAPAATLAS